MNTPVAMFRLPAEPACGRRAVSCTARIVSVLLAFSVPASAQDDGVGYPSVDAAFRALKSEPAAVVTVEGDWMVFRRELPDGTSETWRFTRPGHPAHPGVVLQRTRAASGETGRSTLCQAPYPDGCRVLDEALAE